MLSFGKNVLLSTNPKEIRKVYLAKTKTDLKIIKYLEENHIRYEFIPTKRMNQMCDKNHQGILIERDEYKYSELESLYQENFLIILDHLEDPHNFGAIIRTCEAAGIKGIIIPKDRSVTVNETVMKTSAGTTEYVKIVKVTNLVNTINKLKEKGFFIYGTKMEGKNYKKCNYADKKVLVIGNEGKGISPLVLQNCDETIKIPMKGQVNSLNASVATAILIYNMEDFSEV